MASHLPEVSDQSFEVEVLKSNLPVLVDFWAPWCGPCRTLVPIFEEVASEYQGKVKFVKFNVDLNEIISKKYEVQSIPTLLLFKQGEVVASNLGAISASRLKSFIEENI